jgi:hypothetical protein
MTILIRCADGFHHKTLAPVRVVPREGGQFEIREFDRGTWDLIYTTAFAIEIEVVPA